MSLQLEKVNFSFGGVTYELVCNMAAIEELEADYGGSIKTAFSDTGEHLGAKLTLIMLNRARKKRGEAPVLYADFAEETTYAMFKEIDAVGMLLRALSPSAPRPAGADENGEDPGN